MGFPRGGALGPLELLESANRAQIKSCFKSFVVNVGRKVGDNLNPSLTVLDGEITVEELIELSPV